MAEQLLERLQRAAAHHEPRGEVVASVVEAEVVEPRGGDRGLERTADLALPPTRGPRSPAAKQIQEEGQDHAQQ